METWLIQETLVVESWTWNVGTMNIHHLFLKIKHLRNGCLSPFQDSSGRGRKDVQVSRGRGSFCSSKIIILNVNHVWTLGRISYIFTKILGVFSNNYGELYLLRRFWSEWVRENKHPVAPTNDDVSLRPAIETRHFAVSARSPSYFRYEFGVVSQPTSAWSAKMPPTKIPHHVVNKSLKKW